MNEGAVLRVAASWVGRQTLTVREFRHQFGVYPRTVCHMHHLLPDARWLLKSLWWLKTYPTDQEIINHRASATYFRERLWPCLESLRKHLPEAIFFLWSEISSEQRRRSFPST
jgi:hypothetical protein